jgi:hypothetical protein
VDVKKTLLFFSRALYQESGRWWLLGVEANACARWIRRIEKLIQQREHLLELPSDGMIAMLATPTL